jgi:hypothetical protein
VLNLGGHGLFPPPGISTAPRHDAPAQWRHRERGRGDHDLRIRQRREREARSTSRLADLRRRQLHPSVGPTPQPGDTAGLTTGGWGSLPKVVVKEAGTASSCELVLTRLRAAHPALITTGGPAHAKGQRIVGQIAPDGPDAEGTAALTAATDLLHPRRA